MSAERVLSIRILGDSKSGEKALGSLESAGGKASGASKTLSTALGDVQGKLLGMVPGGQQASGALDKLHGSSDEAGISLKGALVGGAAAAGVAIAGMVKEGLEKFADLTGEVTKFKNVSGATAEEASKLVAVAHATGVETDALSAAMFKLGATAETTPQKLQAVGIEIAKNKDGSIDLTGTLANAAKAYQASTDAAQKDAIAKAIGGKAGAALIPILKQDTSALKEFADEAKKRGEVFSDKDLQKGVEFRKSMREMNEAGGALEITIAKGIVPATTDWLEKMTAAVDEINHLTQSIGGLEGVANFFETVMFGKQKKNTAEAAMEEAAAAAKKQAEETDKLATSEDNNADAAKKEADAENRRKQALDDVLSAESDLIDKDLGYRTSLRDMNSALGDLKTKQDEATAATKEHGKTSGEAKDAAKALADQQDTTAASVVNWAKASADMQEQQHKANGEVFDAQQKQDALRGALEGVADKLAPGASLRTQLQGYIDELKPAGANYTATLSLDDQKARAALAAAQAHADANPVVIPVTFDFGDAQAKFRQMERDLIDQSSVTRQLGAGVR